MYMSKTLDDDSSDDDLTQPNSYCIISSDMNKQSVYSNLCREDGKIKLRTEEEHKTFYEKDNKTVYNEDNKSDKE